MDVDLLRPGTVPISPDTLLGFEFLLDRELLLKHLQKPNPNPSPTTLITKFHEAILTTLRNHVEMQENISAATPSDPIVVDGNESDVKIKHPIKNIAMKILSLKIAAYLNWNLTQIRSLPFKTQINLLQDLLYFTNDGKSKLEIPLNRNVDLLNNLDLNIDVKTASLQFQFSLLLFHRWLLNTAMYRVTTNWQQRFGMNDLSLPDESLICSPDDINKTISILTDALQWESIPPLLTFECFELPTETDDSLNFKWDKGTNVSMDEFRAQISYDLGAFFFFREEYQLAEQHFTNCLNFNNRIYENGGNVSGFCVFDSKVLKMYIKACNPSCLTSSIDKDKSALEQLNHSIVNQYMGITNILQQDNIEKEIPLIHRINLELDIQGAVSSELFTVARDLLCKVKALNHVRCVLAKKNLIEFSYSAHEKNVDSLIWAIQINCHLYSEEDRTILKNYLLELMLKGDIPDLHEKIQNNNILFRMFDGSDWQFAIKNRNYSATSIKSIPTSLIKPEINFWDSNTKKRKPKLDYILQCRKLISTYDWREIKDLLIKLTMIHSSNISNMGNIWEINLQWELPIPLQSVIKSLPKGYIHDCSYVLLAKSRELFVQKNFSIALELLIVLDKELKAALSLSNISKLLKMINWEILLIQITQLMEEWPKSTVDKTSLANACEACFQTNETIVLPRMEVIEACAICLLNLGRWEFLITYTDDKKKWFIFIEILSAIASACHELMKHNSNNSGSNGGHSANKNLKKCSKILWDIILPVFALNSQQTKRSSSCASSSSSSSSNSNIDGTKTNLLLSVFLKLKDSWCLTILISLLSKLFNILKDESNLELQTDYINLWPNTVSNAHSYNINATWEMLFELLQHALKIYPTNISWLRLMGDINFANFNYKVSLSYYIKSLIICNDYFNIPIRYDDHVTRRMIKCCQSLGCYTQAAVLCQFLEEADYGLAFRILGEQKPCNDAVDAYYHCFWDVNILEFLIYIHNRRGEYQRRKCAIQVMGMLELNSNNNEEIQREASNLRKSVFLRALCKQFVF